jgi:hypothetical protein
MGWSNIERNAPYTVDRPWPLQDENNTGALINIRVRQLQGDELGLLNGATRTGPQIDTAIANAFAAKNEDDKKAYNKTTDQLAAMSDKQGYLNSPAHMAWSEAAQERSNGKVSAEQWRKLDPFGGTAGNGPDVINFPGVNGRYPGNASVISMGHDTDWSLGRYFNAGPMKALHTSQESPLQMGMYGLQNHSAVRPKVSDLYTTGGHADWEVDYGKNRQELDQKLQERERRALYGANPNQENSVLVSAKTNAVVSANDFGERGEHFNKALSAANGNTDVAAAVLRSSAAAGHDPKGEFRVEVSTTNGALIPAQGTGPGVNRGDGVVASQVQPGTAQNVAEALTQKNPAQQIASVEPQPEKQQAPRTV